MLNPVRAIGPIMPLPLSNVPYELLKILVFALVLNGIIQIILHRTPQYEKNNKYLPVYHAVTAVATASMLFAFGWSRLFLRGVFFIMILLYASVCDIQTHRVSDCVSVMIVLTGFIGTESLFGHLAASLAVGGFMLVCAILTKNRIGGADVKLTAACVFVLGLRNGITGLILGLLLSVAVILFRQNGKKAFPLVPYLAVGFTAAYFF